MYCIFEITLDKRSLLSQRKVFEKHVHFSETQKHFSSENGSAVTPEKKNYGGTPCHLLIWAAVQESKFLATPTVSA